MEVRGNKTETVRQGRAGQGGWMFGWLAGACACAGMGSRGVAKGSFLCGAVGLGWVGCRWVGRICLILWRFGRKVWKEEGGGGMIWVGGEKMWNF